MKDRIVQHPNRYKLTQVSGDIYDLAPEPGIVTEEGTNLNKANLFPDDVATALGLNPSSNPTVKDGFLALAPVLDRVDDILLTTTLSANAQSVTLNLANANTGQYHIVRLVATAINLTTDANVNVTIEGVTSDSYTVRAVGGSVSTLPYIYSRYAVSDAAQGSGFILDFHQVRSYTGKIGSVSARAYPDLMEGNLPTQYFPNWEGITSIELTAVSGYIRANAKFTVYGVKL